MISIRLTRVGRKHAPTYRIVVMPKTRDPWAKSLEIIGSYNPVVKPSTFIIDQERLSHWMSQGAEVTNTVWNLLVSHDIIKDKKRSVTHITKKRRESLAAKQS